MLCLIQTSALNGVTRRSANFEIQSWKHSSERCSTDSILFHQDSTSELISLKSSATTERQAQKRNVNKKILKLRVPTHLTVFNFGFQDVPISVFSFAKQEILRQTREKNETAVFFFFVTHFEFYALPYYDGTKAISKNLLQLKHAGSRPVKPNFV